MAQERRTKLSMSVVLELRRRFAMHAPPVPDWFMADVGDHSQANRLERLTKWAWVYAESMMEEEVRQAGGAD